MSSVSNNNLVRVFKHHICNMGWYIGRMRVPLDDFVKLLSSRVQIFGHLVATEGSIEQTDPFVFTVNVFDKFLATNKLVN